MKINDFKLEVYFSKYEFTAPYLLTQSDCESMTTKELLAYELGSEEEYMNLWLGYSETSGDPELRDIIAGLYKDMKRENIFVWHGAQEAIFAYMNIMLDEGDHMIAQYPNYQSAYEVANTIPNCSYDKWWVRDMGDRWGMDFDELERMIKPNTKLIAINSPNNPTGFTFTNDEMKRLIEICKKHDLYLFCDEVYRGIELDGEERIAAADLYDKAVSLGVLSKAYGLAGLRVGWFAAKDLKLLDRCAKFKNYLSICDAVPAEFLAKVALKHDKELRQRSLDLIKENKKIADAFFAKYPHVFEPKALQAGPVTYHKLLLDMPVAEFCQKAVDSKGVLLLPSTIYNEPGETSQYFRMGYGRKNMPEALAKFEEFLIEEKLV